MKGFELCLNSKHIGWWHSLLLVLSPFLFIHVSKASALWWLSQSVLECLGYMVYRFCFIRCNPAQSVHSHSTPFSTLSSLCIACGAAVFPFSSASKCHQQLWKLVGFSIQTKNGHWCPHCPTRILSDACVKAINHYQVQVAPTPTSCRSSSTACDGM